MTRGVSVRGFLCGCAALLLAACGSGGPVKRVNPPIASIQQLAVQPDGSWKMDVRIQNFSTVPMTFDTLEIALEVDDKPGAQIFVHPKLDIPGNAADVTGVTVTATPAGNAALRAALANGSVGYRVTGKITTSEPAKSFDLRYESRLSPVPGLPGTWR
jgi:hypothetical protein